MIYSNPQYEFKNIERLKICVHWMRKQITERKKCAISSKLMSAKASTVCITLMHIIPLYAAAYLNAYAGKLFKTSKLSNCPDYTLAQISEPNLIPFC